MSWKWFGLSALTGHGVIASAALPGAATSGPICATTTSLAPFAAEILDDVKDIAAGSHDDAATLRSVHHIPRVTESEVFLISDEARCEQVARIHSRTVWKDSTAVARPNTAVINVGPTRHVVFDFRERTYLAYFSTILPLIR